MSAHYRNTRHAERGVGLIEVMIGIVIGMLLMLVIYQVYEISEGQKRTITAGSDASQNASYGLYVLGRDLSMAGYGIASSAVSLDTCAMLRPIPVIIDSGATDNDPDTITVLYGGSSSLATSVPIKQPATGAQPYVVPGPVGFSQNDVIAAVQGPSCTISTVNAGGIAVDGVTGVTTIAHTPVAGDLAATYGPGAPSATLVNLGQATSMGRIAYTVDATNRVLRAQNRLPTDGPVNPIINDIVNIKAQYGLDTNNDGSIDAWQDATGIWSAASLPLQPLATLQQIRAVRIGIVTRSAQYEKVELTSGTPPGMPNGTIGIFCDPAPACAATMTLSADDQHYRYKVLETAVPLRNALWN